MPKKKSGTFDQKAYINEYVKANVVYRRVNLSRNNPEDMEVLEWIDRQPEGPANYIKRLIMDDMRK